MDANGQPDFESFDQFKVEGEKYRLSGDFGFITIDPPVLELAE